MRCRISCLSLRHSAITAEMEQTVLAHNITNVILSSTGSWHHEVHSLAVTAVKFTRFLCRMSDKKLLDCYKETMEETASNNIKVVSISCNSNLASNATVVTSVNEFVSTQNGVLPASLSISILCTIAVISSMLAYLVIYYRQRRRKASKR